MTAWVVAGCYVLLGCLAVVVVVRQPGRRLPYGRVATGLLTLVLWPFILPAVVQGEGAVPVATGNAPGSARAARIDAVACRILEGWAQVSPGGAEGRERAGIEAFIARLRRSDKRLGEVEATLPGAPGSVRDRLVRLRDLAATDTDKGIALLEELAAQMTLLRFADLAEPSAARVESDHIEDLLARIEALADVGSTDAHQRPAGQSGTP
jgi:hypothetical protein